MRQHHRKLKNLERGYFYCTRYIGNQNIAADSHSRQQAPFCLKRHPFRHLNCRLFRYDSIAFDMQVESCMQDGKTVAVITGTELVPTGAQSALDLIMTRAMRRTPASSQSKELRLCVWCGCVICV